MGSKVSVHRHWLLWTSEGAEHLSWEMWERKLLMSDGKQMERLEGARLPGNTLSDKHHLLAPSAEDQAFNILGTF